MGGEYGGRGGEEGREEEGRGGGRREEGRKERERREGGEGEYAVHVRKVKR